MYLDSDKIVTMTAANQNFSAVARQTERDGKSVIFKNNRPKFVLIDLEGGGYLDLTDDERIDVVARRIMKRHKPRFWSWRNDEVHERESAASAPVHCGGDGRNGRRA